MDVLTERLAWLTPLSQYFNYIMTIRLLVEETGENHRPVASH
jgi:hypothetical protein